jgi:hypothetical protein
MREAMEYSSSMATPPGPQMPPARRIAARGWARHPFLLALFILINALSVALPSWGIGGVPIRAFVTATVLFYTATAHHRIFMRVAHRHRLILYLFFGFAVLGVIVSLANYTEPLTILRQVIEIHLQAALLLLIAAVLVELCGPIPVLWMFAIPVGLSVLFAFAQALNVDAAWALRNSLGGLQQELVDKSESMELKGRPLGLSYSPIALATQLCLCFAGYGVLRESRRRLTKRRRSIDKKLIGAAFVFLAVCLLSGNRSPMLGMALFLLFYLARQKRLGFWLILMPVGLLTLVLFGPMLLDYLQGTGSRVVSLEDKSAMGRIALYYYGTLLFVNNPIGYGLAFDPTQHWQQYWDQISYLPNAATVQNFPLHNYVLSMLNFYGVGVFLLSPMLYMLYRDYRWTVIYFVPYMMHIMFHNSGPFWSDPLVWIILAVAAGMRIQMRDARQRDSDGHSETAPAAALAQSDLPLG